MFARLTFALFGYEGFTHETICSGKPLMPRYMFARLTILYRKFEVLMMLHTSYQHRGIVFLGG